MNTCRITSGIVLLFLLAGASATPAAAGEGRESVILTGLDVLARDDFAALKGKKVGLVTNHSALSRKGGHIVDLMLESENVEFAAFFSPEHGFFGREDRVIADAGKEEKTGLPIHSLYGATRKPTPEMLAGVEVLVFDIQDIGARFYTYISTMGNCMQAAAEAGIPFMVLDRPNPIGGLYVNGPVQDDDLLGGFTTFAPMPIAHGMTVGELARLFRERDGIKADLTVVPVEGWKRDVYYDETGLFWVNPSPNMRSVAEELLYPGMALVEASNISVGRGTDAPFELIGAPFVDPYRLTAELRSRRIPGLGFNPVRFKPDSSKFANEECGGFRVSIIDRQKVDIVAAGIHLLDALYRLYPDTFDLQRNRGLLGAQWVIDAIKAGEPVEAIVLRWNQSPEFRQFMRDRKNALLY